MAPQFRAVLAALACVALSLVVEPALALPNIRIQVNNENNLKNAPYLLEEASRRLQELPSPIQASQDPIASAAPESGELAADSGAQGGATFSVVKEETIEEILDLEPESVIKLAPQNLIDSVQFAPSGEQQPQLIASSSFGSHQQEASSLQTTAHDNNNNNNNSPPSNGGRKPSASSQQLPVANSHLKKPAHVVGDEESAGQPESSGAKSLVSPTILLEAPPSATDDKLLKTKKAGQQPPDVWEPSQVMSGVSNISLVPAIVNRDYGSQTRTRVTLGGGYQRDRQPVDADPERRQPEKSHTGPRPIEVGGGSSSSSSSSSSFSHLVEVPERIILPASALQSQSQPPKQANKPIKSVQQASSSNASVEELELALQQAPPGRQQKLDSRCPKQGVVTFEHPSACDKYFFCEDGYLSEQTCPNGLLYGLRDTVRDYCVHRWKATCEDKQIPNPISSPGCRWQYGIFSVQGSPKCTPDFYECIEGRFEVRKCSVDGQVYDDRTKSCQFSEAVGCAQETLGDFQCPSDDQTNTYWPFPRYFLNERALIHCVNDKPEIIRCQNEERVDPEHLHCVPVVKLQPKAAQSSAPDVPAERRTRERKREKAAAAAASRRR